jgi:hypothetical protein
MVVAAVVAVVWVPWGMCQECDCLDAVNADPQSYVGEIKNRAGTITGDEAEGLDVDQLEDRDKIRREASSDIIEYANEFTRNCDVQELKQQLCEVFPEEYVNQIPDHVMTYIHSLDMIELDDYFAKTDNNPEATKLDKIKMAFVMMSLAAHAVPPGGELGHDQVVDEDVPTVDDGWREDLSADAQQYGDPDFLDKMSTYEDGFLEMYEYKVPAPRATDQEEGEGAIKECTDNFDRMVPRLQEIAQMANGLDNSLTTNWWRNLQGAGVEQCAEGESSLNMQGANQFGSEAIEGEDGTFWRVKEDWWFHKHEDGTIRSFAQEATDTYDPYQPPPLNSGAQLLATEIGVLESDDPFSCDLGKYRALISNAEQKILYIDYEHFPKGMQPGKISEGIWGYSEDGNPIAVGWFDASLCTPEQTEEGIRFDYHFQPDGTQMEQPEEVAVSSDYPEELDPEGHWDMMIIRAAYWADINIPIYEYNRSYQASYPEEEGTDPEEAPHVKVEDVVLRMEKEVDAMDVPPDLVPYTIPPLLEPPLPPTTFTRNEYPLGVSYSGRGGVLQ